MYNHFVYLLLHDAWGGLGRTIPQSDRALIPDLFFHPASTLPASSQLLYISFSFISPALYCFRVFTSGIAENPHAESKGTIVDLTRQPAIYSFVRSFVQCAYNRPPEPHLDLMERSASKQPTDRPTDIKWTNAARPKLESPSTSLFLAPFHHEMQFKLNTFFHLYITGI